MTIQNSNQNPSQNPEEWEKLIAGYVLGDLTPEEVAEVNQLLAIHPELIAEVGQLQEVLSLLPLALPDTYPSVQLRSQILKNAQITASPSAASPQILKTSSPRTSLPKTYLVGGAIAALLLGIGFDSYRTKQQLAIAQNELSVYQQAIATLKQPNNRLLALKGMENLPATSGSLVIATQTNSGFLTIQNLSMPPQNMIYCLWAVVNGKKTYIADFMPDRTGTVLLAIPINQISLRTKSVVITLETKQNVPAATGEMIMQGEISL